MRTKLLLAASNLVLLTFIILGWTNKNEKIIVRNPDPVCNTSLSTRISPVTAQMLADTYKAGMECSGEKKDFKDSRSVWYSLSELENFICLIKSTVNNYGCGKSLGPLGIRIYFGRYPQLNTMRQQDDFNTLPNDYAGLHTLFMIPTYERNQQNIDFDPGIGFGEKGKCFPPPLDGKKSKASYYTTPNPFMISPIPNENSNRYIEKNHGQLIPPEDETGAFFLDHHNPANLQ